MSTETTGDDDHIASPGKQMQHNELDHGTEESSSTNENGSNAIDTMSGDDLARTNVSTKANDSNNFQKTQTESSDTLSDATLKCQGEWRSALSTLRKAYTARSPLTSDEEVKAKYTAYTWADTHLFKAYKKEPQSDILSAAKQEVADESTQLELERFQYMMHRYGLTDKWTVPSNTGERVDVEASMMKAETTTYLDAMAKAVNNGWVFPSRKKVSLGPDPVYGINLFSVKEGYMTRSEETGWEYVPVPQEGVYKLEPGEG